jgi:hypothetical protein
VNPLSCLFFLSFFLLGFFLGGGSNKVCNLRLIWKLNKTKFQRPKWVLIVGRFCQPSASACHNSRILTTANHHHQSATTGCIPQFANASQILATVLLPLDRSRQPHVPVISKSTTLPSPPPFVFFFVNPICLSTKALCRRQVVDVKLRVFQ